VSATRYPAEFFGMQDSLGTIAPGKLADLVLLDADPLADIRNTTTLRGVVVNGRYLDRAALDALLAAEHYPGRPERRAVH
jgi:imidazolonepropionase-like amidohydrolase